MKLRAPILAAALCVAAISFAAGPPLAGAWNIAPKGRAASSGDLHFRIRQNDGSDPVDITVPVMMGAKETTIARGIRNSLGSQLPSDRFRVELGEGTNVLVSDARGQPSFSLELVDSDVDELRVAVQGVAPMASPTVPMQSVPAEPPPVPPSSGDAPGAVSAPAGTTIPVPGAGMGIPDNSTPRVPNTSPPAPAPAPAPATPSPTLPPPPPAPAPEPAPGGTTGAPPPTR